MTLESQVASLTTATTELLDAVNVKKTTLDASVATATTKAGEASGSAASALAIYGNTAAMNTAVSTSTTNAATATTQAGIATTQATAAAASAVSAASSASSAALIVTGGSPFLLNAMEITADITLPSGFNAASAGPIEIDNNVNVTISDNSTWSIV